MTQEEAGVFLKELGELCTKHRLELWADQEGGTLETVRIPEGYVVVVSAAISESEHYPLSTLRFTIEKKPE